MMVVLELLGSVEFSGSEPGEFSIPIDGIRPTGLDGIDGALGDTGDAVYHGIAP